MGLRRLCLLPMTLLVVGLVGCGLGSDRQVLPIREDFSTCNAPEIDEEQEVGCVNGEGRFLFKDTENRVGAFNALLLPRSMDSVSVASDVTLHSVSGNAAKQLVWGGVVCMASQEDKPAKGYEFVVLPRTHEFAILLLDETDPTVEQWTRTKALYLRTSETVRGVGSSNRVRGECRGANGTVQLTMWVNGEEVGHATDSRFPSFEQVAIQATSTENGTDIRFDNFLADQVG
jgi:hypothetical protein